MKVDPDSLGVVDCLEVRRLLNGRLLALAQVVDVVQLIRQLSRDFGQSEVSVLGLR